ncbi:MAG: molybdate ABC transporter substrate-binding protein [Magnetococcales bacterium]|nr:molybdate ABC transporter substrate-binding protein [Magnetococcales bacterium]
MRLPRLTLLILLLCWPGLTIAEEIHVAVAANFKKPFTQLANLFEAQTGHRLLISSGSTGKLFAQIVNGAPYQLFLSADQQRPSLLAQMNLADPKSQFTYAMGRLALWRPKGGDKPLDEEYFHPPPNKRIAISNPKLAPYGLAAKEVLLQLKIWEALRHQLSFGENAGQTLAFLSSGNVDSGFVALSQILDTNPTKDQIWIIPSAYYNPIRQDAILLNTGKESPGPGQLLEFLKSPPIREQIEQWGYSVP